MDCVNCELMEKQLRNAFLELKSAENSISVLREDLKCNTVGLTADHHGNPRKRNFVQEENDKLRGRQVRKKNLPTKFPTLVNGSIFFVLLLFRFDWN